MPQLDLVTFPSQVFWLAIIFLCFYAFVSGHFVPLLHKIVQTRSKKIKNLSTFGYSTSSEFSYAGPESLVVPTFDSFIASLNISIEEAVFAQSVVLRSGSCFKACSLAGAAGTTQGRYLFSRGLLF